MNDSVKDNAVRSDRRWFGVLKLLLAVLVPGILGVASQAQMVSPFNLPLYFESNPAGTEFLSRGSGYQFLISAGGAQIALRNGADRPDVARMSFVGENARAAVHGDGELAGKINYLIGNDSSKWQTGLPTFSRVQVSNAYPGINLVFHGNQQQLEYDFDVAPGANPSAIKIHFDGTDKISIALDGELVLKIGASEIRQPKPEIYPTTAGERKIISGSYKLLDAWTVAFRIGNYDHSQPLVIDPLLSFSTYFGGNLSVTGGAIALDTSNNVYIAGLTFSKQFFTRGAFQTNFAGGTFAGDAFVAKFGNPATNLIYLTYLGGNGDDGAFAIAVDSSSRAFVAGATESTNFPVLNAVPGFHKISGKLDTHDGLYPADVFVTELSADGSSLVYSTYLGGNSSDTAYGIALDSADNAYITGFTYSTNFPVFPDPASVLQNHLACTNSFFLNANAFVSEIASGGGALVYSTYLGGTNFDTGRAITVDANNYVYVAGFTASTNFPVINAPANAFSNFPAITHLNGATNSQNRVPFDAFVTKFPPLNTYPSNLSQLVYSTFLGGTNSDQANGIAADSAGNAYVTGWTTSTNFPVVFSSLINTNPAGLYSFLTTNGNAFSAVTNVFLTKIAPQGSNILNSIVFGGNGMDIGNGVAVDLAGDAFVVGTSSSTNFPTVNTFNNLSHTNNLGLDVFVTGISADWTSTYYSVLIGGKKDEQGYGIALDSATNAFITGYTASTNFPTQFAGRFSFFITNNFNLTNITFTTNDVDGTNVITTNTVLIPTNSVTTGFINGTNFINGSNFTGTNDAFLAEILFAAPVPTNIVVTPPGATNGVGANVTFSVTGNGAGTPVLFQWQREIFTNQIITNIIIGVSTNKMTNSLPSGVFTNLLNKSRFSGVTSDILSITNLQTADTGTYSILITFGGTPITSNILLEVESGPVIITPPEDQTNIVGDTVTFTVTALGQPPLHYQWQLNGTNLVNHTGHVSGATTNTLIITDVNTNNEGSYEVVITNSFGSTNVSATLTLVTAPLIITPLTNQVVGLGAVVPFVLTVVGGAPLHFSWTMNGAPLANGGRISGATNDTLTLTGATTNDDGTYEVTVTNAFGSTNSSATLTVLTAPMFTTMSFFNGSNLAGGLQLNGIGAISNGNYVLYASSNLLFSPVTNTWTNVLHGTIPSPGSFTATILPTGIGALPELTNWSQAYFILVSSNGTTVP